MHRTALNNVVLLYTTLAVLPTPSHVPILIAGKV
jgi:hypothetical protein